MMHVRYPRSLRNVEDLCMLEPIGNFPPAKAEEGTYAMLDDQKLAA